MAKKVVYDPIIGSLREHFFSFDLESFHKEEDKPILFADFLSLLKKRGVLKCDGSIRSWRLPCLQYLDGVMPLLDEEDVVGINENDFFDRFVFAPVGKTTSLYHETKGYFPGGYFCNIPLDDVYAEYVNTYGKSPYEKADIGEINSFLVHIS